MIDSGGSGETQGPSEPEIAGTFKRENPYTGVQEAGGLFSKIVNAAKEEQMQSSPLSRQELRTDEPSQKIVSEVPHTSIKDEVSHEQLRTESPFFKAARTIYRPDGWLGEKVFWGCTPEQHDACAQYVLGKLHPAELERIRNGEDEKFSTVRNALFGHGFAQISHNYVVSPEGELTEEQTRMIKERGLRVPVRITDSRVKQELEGMQRKIEEGLYTEGELELMKSFFDNGLKYHVDNDPERATSLYKTLTVGLEDGGWYQDQLSYVRTYELAYPKDESFVIQLLNHKHDGQSGLEYSSWVDVLSWQDAVETFPEIGEMKKV